MRTLALHPKSLLAGALLTVVVGLAAAARQVASAKKLAACLPCAPAPHAMVVIRQEQGPWTVPAGKLFVLTGLGAASYATTYPAALSLNGVQELANLGIGTVPFDGGIDVQPVSVGECPIGFTAPAGSTVAVSHPGGDARAWGYLVDA